METLGLLRRNISPKLHRVYEEQRRRIARRMLKKMRQGTIAMRIKPKIGVIMPTYNGAKFIRRSINSVLEQRLKNFELIIINDGSTDATKKIIF